MSNNIYVLHLSDLHMAEEYLDDIKIIRNALLKDINKIQNEKNFSIDFVCFTGDLIWCGEYAECQIELACDNFIFPLLEEIKLGNNNFFIVPGNHEVDQTKIDEISEEGLKSRLSDRDQINNFIDNNLEDKYIKRISYFNEYIKFFAENPVWESPLAFSYIREKNNQKIGFACLNSAWRSTGEGPDEKDKLILGERQVYQAYQEISNCDLRIALMHHPTEWFKHCDQRAVELSLNNFDIILNGHLHDLQEKQIATRGQESIFCSSGSLYKGRTHYNGYSIIEINPITLEVNLFLRQYYDDRKEFSKALSIVEEGRITYKLDYDNPISKIGLASIEEFKESFKRKANDELISGIVDEEVPEELEKIFVKPDLNTNSEYVKEKRSNTNNIDLKEIIKNNKNVLFIGKKETGKTTLLNYISLYYLDNFNKKVKFPFIIDFTKRLPGKTPIEKEMVKFILSNSDYEININKPDVIELLKSGSCILLFDDLEINNSNKLDKLKKFINKYPENRYIFTLNENIFQTITDSTLPELNCDYKEVYIRTLSKNNIRNLTAKWFCNKSVNIDDILEKIMSYFIQLGIPRTPLNVSLILTIYSNQASYVPRNEASIMERFMEIVLEKLSLDETKVSSYDFKIKEMYLSHLAWKMAQKNEFYLSKSKYLEITNEYFNKRGWDLDKSRFDTLFFEKKVLLEYDGNVYFRYKSMAEYYLAKKALNDSEVLNWMLEEENYLKFINEISFLTGLHRDHKDIMQKVQSRLLPQIEDYIDRLKSLKDYGLQIDVPFEYEEIQENMEDLKLETEEKDQLLDYPDLNTDFESQIIEKDKEIDMPDEHLELKILFDNLLLYGRIIRNNEGLNIEDKINALRLCITGYCILLAIFKNKIEDMITKENLEAELDKFELEREVKEKEVSTVQDIFKILIPLSLQNFVAENIGSSKLKQTIKRLIEEDNDEFSNFMYTFLYSDLKLPGYIKHIKDFYKEIESDDLKKLTLYKMLFYYCTGYFRDIDEDRVTSLIADMILDLQGTSTHLKGRPKKVIKHRVIDQIRNSGGDPEDLLNGQV